jgi:glucokinase
MGSTSLITELPGDAQPRGAVSGPGTGQSVGDLVEQNLVDVVIISEGREVSGNGDASFVVIAGAETSFCVVKGKRPRLIQVECDEGVCPHAHSM